MRYLNVVVGGFGYTKTTRRYQEGIYIYSIYIHWIRSTWRGREGGIYLFHVSLYMLHMHRAGVVGWHGLAFVLGCTALSAFFLYILGVFSRSYFYILPEIVCCLIFTLPNRAALEYPSLLHSEPSVCLHQVYLTPAGEKQKSTAIDEKPNPTDTADQSTPLPPFHVMICSAVSPIHLLLEPVPTIPMQMQILCVCVCECV